MTSNCGKNRKVAAHKPLGKCVTDLLVPHFDVFFNLLLTDCAGQSLLSYIIKKPKHDNVIYTSVL